MKKSAILILTLVTVFVLQIPVNAQFGHKPMGKRILDQPNIIEILDLTPEQAKQFNDKRKQARETVTNQPHVQEIQMQIKDQKEKLKDLQELLSHYLLEYYNETKSNEVADHEGKARKVVINARLGSKKEE